MHLKNLNKAELDVALEMISESELRTIINEDISNRKGYMAFFKKSKLDRITKDEILKYIYKSVYEQEVNKYLLLAIVAKIADRIAEIDTENIMDKVVELINGSELTMLTQEQTDQLAQYRTDFNSLGFALGFDACLRIANKKIIAPPEIPDINLEKAINEETEKLANLIADVTSEVQRLRKENELLIPKTDLLSYKSLAQQEIKDLKKEVKNLRKELQISSQKLEDEQKKSFVKKHLTILPTQIKKLVSDLAIVEDDSLKAIWRKVTDKETDLISKIPNTEAEKKQQSDLLSKLLAFKYIVLRIYEGEDKT
jgi:hypothetical protein